MCISRCRASKLAQHRRMTVRFAREGGPRLLNAYSRGVVAQHRLSSMGKILLFVRAMQMRYDGRIYGLRESYRHCESAWALKLIGY